MSDSDYRVWGTPKMVEHYLSVRRAGRPFMTEMHGVMLELLRAMDGPVARILDLGAGDGVLAATVLSAFPRAQAVVVDFSAPMLAEARRNLAPFGTQITFIQADLTDPGWVAQLDGPFDAVVSGFAIHHLTDLRKRDLYGEVYHLLRAGGFFINLEHVASATPWISHRWEEAYIDGIFASRHQDDPTLTREAVAMDFRARLDKDANILAPLDTQCAWLRDLGYHDVDCYFKWLEMAVFGGRR